MYTTVQEAYNNIAASGKSIYDIDNSLYIQTKDLEILLANKFLGASFNGLPLRTRSKEMKKLVCTALGYPVPKSFQKCKPRFLAQNLDTYMQKSNNLQIWNETVDSERRYAIFKLDDNDVVISVKVFTGSEIQKYDTTGKITIKHQAIIRTSTSPSELISPYDTEVLQPLLATPAYSITSENPLDQPVAHNIYPISRIYSLLSPLVGQSFADAGCDQERNRGASLHSLLCRALGYSKYGDNGQFPDILNQLLEVKLQTSPTIDLGALSPDSPTHFPVPLIYGTNLAPRDIRYAIFYAVTDGDIVTLTNFYLTNGRDFYTRFPQMEGNFINGKLQIPLPADLFR